MRYGGIESKKETDTCQVVIAEKSCIYSSIAEVAVNIVFCGLVHKSQFSELTDWLSLCEGGLWYQAAHCRISHPTRT